MIVQHTPRPSRLWPRAGCAVLAALLLSACSSGGGSQTGGGDPFSAIDPGKIAAAAFYEVTVADCLASPYVDEQDRLQVVDCAVPGAIQIVAVSTLGSQAPAEKPVDEAISGLALAACAGPFAKWATRMGLDVSGFLRVASYPLADWSGPETPVVCGAQIHS